METVSDVKRVNPALNSSENVPSGKELTVKMNIWLRLSCSSLDLFHSLSR